jgi:hypothetical protein
MKRNILAVLCVFVLFTFTTLPAYADERITYVSQPEAVTIFLNDIAFARDTLTLTGGSEVQIVLPDQIYADTLILRENGARIPAYTLSRATGPLTLKIGASSNTDVREITLEYLVYGLRWKPNYDMAFSESSDTVRFAFFAEISNSTFALDGVDVTLAAGRVDISQPVSAAGALSMNQYIAGYDETTVPTATITPGAVTIQHQYPLGALTIAPGDTLYTQVLDSDFTARRLLLWNAASDRQVAVIYKMKNESQIALAEGIVRSYQDGLFVGSDSMEFTPIGSEGSITVGSLPDVRVNRAETSTYEDMAFSNNDYLHEITLTLSNFGPDDLEIEVVDNYPAESGDFTFSSEPQRDAGNLLRWMVTIPVGETVTITYSYRATY